MPEKRVTSDIIITNARERRIDAITIMSILSAVFLIGLYFWGRTALAIAQTFFFMAVAEPVDAVIVDEKLKLVFFTPSRHNQNPQPSQQFTPIFEIQLDDGPVRRRSEHSFCFQDRWTRTCGPLPSNDGSKTWRVLYSPKFEMVRLPTGWGLWGSQWGRFLFATLLFAPGAYIYYVLMRFFSKPEVIDPELIAEMLDRQASGNPKK